MLVNINGWWFHARYRDGKQVLVRRLPGNKVATFKMQQETPRDDVAVAG